MGSHHCRNNRHPAFRERLRNSLGTLQNNSYSMSTMQIITAPVTLPVRLTVWLL
jgi:hypothetical protein